jgi:DNA-binding response OmpR family regulator
VLLDIEMPEMDGYQVLETCLQDADLREIPIIMTSSLDEINSVVKCVELGAEDYLNKPVNPILLRARVNASLEKKRLRDEQRKLLHTFATKEVVTNC